MRIATIIPGPAGPFFEKNSQREQALVAELRWNGHDVLFVPILFPLKSGSRNLPTPEVTPLFGGAVRAYLTHLFPRLCKRLPRGIWALLNTECLRHFAVRRLLKSPKQLTRFLKTALDGHENAQQTSIRELSQWLAQEGPIDIVLLSTPFLLGLAPTLKRTLQIPVACAMNSELEDLALLEGPDAIVLLTKLRSVIAAADGFIATSLFHAKRIQNRLGVPLDATYTIHPGLPSTEDPAPMPAGTPCLGIVASHAAHAHAIRVPSLLTTFYPRFGSQITVRLFASQNPGQSTHVSLGIAEALATYPALRLESANLDRKSVV